MPCKIPADRLIQTDTNLEMTGFSVLNNNQNILNSIYMQYIENVCNICLQISESR